MRQLRVGLAAVVGLVLAACNPDAQGPIDDPLVSAPTLNLAIGDPLGLADPQFPTFNDLYSSLWAAHRSCGPGSSSGQFDCPYVNGDLTFTFRYTFFNQDGNVQPSYDPLTTASVSIATASYGSTSVLGIPIRHNRAGFTTVTGLTGAETTRTLNSAENGIRNMGFGGDSTMTSVADTVRDLVVPVGAGPRNRSPLSGTVIHATSERGHPLIRLKEVFADGIVTVEITIGSETRTCRLALPTNSISPCLS